MTDSTDPAVRLLAERLWREYDSQYSASHLTWMDFEPEARGHLDALRKAGLLVTPQASSAERSEEELVHEVARAIRDAYEQLPDGTVPDFTDVSDWYGEARAAIAAIRGEDR